ncbi:MAG: hypothetical protein IRZ09_04380 [Variibacter sp.]|nr:hypothetical protein [Variibacter sp.]
MPIGFRNTALAFGFAGALTISLPNAGLAAPVTAGSATGLKAATDALPGAVTSVRWRGRHYGHGGALVAGLAAGIIGAAAISAFAPRYDYYPYYSEPYYYGGPVYYGAPSYYTPYWGYHRRVHWGSRFRHHRWGHRHRWRGYARW